MINYRGINGYNVGVRFVITMVFTTSKHHKLTKNYTKMVGSFESNVPITQQHMFTGLDESPTTLANVLALSDDIKY